MELPARLCCCLGGLAALIAIHGNLWWQWSDADEPAGPERELVALAGLRKEIEGQQGRQEGWNYARQLI